MHAPSEAIIHPHNAQEAKRIFIVSDMDHERVCFLASRVMDIYAEVTGKDFHADQLADGPIHIADAIETRGQTELRYGMPNLRGSAHDHGKLRAGHVSLFLPGNPDLNAAKFWVDTNDFTRTMPIPVESSMLVNEFDTRLQDLAESEFDDISVPIPLRAFHLGLYNPAFND